MFTAQPSGRISINGLARMEEGVRVRGRIPLMIVMLCGLAAVAQPAQSAGQQPAGRKPTGKQAAIIDNMAEQTEALVEALLARNKKAAEHQHHLLKTNLGKLHTLAKHGKFNERRKRELFTAYSWMRLISIDIREKAWIGAAIAANQMNGEIIRFTDFPNLTLRDVAWMDFLGRDAMLLAMEDMQGNAQSIELRRTELTETWQRVREDMIKDFRNKSLVLRGDQLVDAIGHAGDRKSLIGLLRNELAFVDDVEKALGTD